MSALIIYVGEHSIMARHSVFGHVFVAASGQTREDNKRIAKYELLAFVRSVHRAAKGIDATVVACQR